MRTPTIPDNPLRFVDPELEVATENYYARLRYDREITERFFWFVLGGWDRNRPAGIENRYAGGAGVGNIWIDRDKVSFRTDYGLTYTSQENTVPPDQDFAGARGSWAYKNQLTETTIFTNDLIIDLNLDETDDLRADMISGVQVAMTDKIALKVSLQWLYDAQPSFEDVVVFDEATDAQIGTVPVELEELDSILSASVVINF